MSISELISRWSKDPEFLDAIQTEHRVEGHQADLVSMPGSLHPALAEALNQHGIEKLYTHQAASFEMSQAGQDLMILSGTASGKTLCYNLPVLDHLLKNPKGRALFLFPTKALAQDQSVSLQKLIAALPPELHNGISQISQAIYDGDTPTNKRSTIRKDTRIVISNPDMLHLGILPHHTQWAEFMANLHYIILDEAHTYRGVFGSHVANVLRRLQRIARFYGADLRFILTSATIANPGEFACKLIGRNLQLVADDGSERGSKSILIYNPPMIDPELGLRRSALQESVRIAQEMLDQHIQTIIFGRSRRTVELLVTYLRQSVRQPYPPAFMESQNQISTSESERPQGALVRGYRSGYLPEERRAIERGLRDGSIQIVAATNALELGIDIGGMGAAILVGYPGTIASTWQQIGRAGRRGADAVAIFVATADPLDQFLASHPSYLFGKSPEQALINPDNPLILLEHLCCAAFELPFKEGEHFGDLDPAELDEYIQYLQEQGKVHQAGEKYYWMADQYPAQGISLRSADSNPIQLQVLNADVPKTIGQVDRTSAHWMVHPNAVYLHEAETYLVEELDLEKGIARMSPTRSDYYTSPRRDTNVGLIEMHSNKDVKGGQKSEGEIMVTSRVTGFKKIRWFTHETIGIENLEMPAVELLTTGYWLSVSKETVDKLEESGLWTNRPNNYGPNWENQRQRARQRDGYRCQVCGILENNRSHHVHHRTPFRFFTTFLQANQLENLVTLCPDCHRRVETALRVRSGLAGLGFVLGNLAPFNLMCDPADLGVHSDPQSALAGGMPAVVIYDQVPAGLGFSRRLYESHDELVLQAHELVVRCACSDGCPSCTGPGGELGAGGKAETLALLQQFIA